eukprot:SAG11_NODE_620_length_8171_cov_9.337339_1_plen_110_part_00
MRWECEVAPDVWVDYEPQLGRELEEQFLLDKKSHKFVRDGMSYRLDFERMTQLRHLGMPIQKNCPTEFALRSVVVSRQIALKSSSASANFCVPLHHAQGKRSDSCGARA